MEKIKASFRPNRIQFLTWSNGGSIDTSYTIKQKTPLKSNMVHIQVNKEGVTTYSESILSLLPGSAIDAELY